MDMYEDAKTNLQSVSLNKVNVDIDWVEAGKLNPIQNQGMCGSSWAFSSIAAV